MISVNFKDLKLQKYICSAVDGIVFDSSISILDSETTNVNIDEEEYNFLSLIEYDDIQLEMDTYDLYFPKCKIINDYHCILFEELNYKKNGVFNVIKTQ